MTRRLYACRAVLFGAACVVVLLASHRLTDSASLQRAADALLEPDHPPPAGHGKSFNNESGLEDTSSGTRSLVNRIHEIQAVIRKQRDMLYKEMKGYNYPNGQYNVAAKSLADLVPELGGQPLRTIVITSWRSGSTFLGDVLNSHPGNFYHYEPLSDYDIIQIRGGPLASEASSNMKALLNCNYTGLDHYLSYGKTHQYLFTLNERLWAQCKKYPHLCWLPDFLSPFCRLFPFQSMKVVRLRLKIIEELLTDPSLNIKVVFLVRDPRGTLQSRKHPTWCPENPDCSEPALLCSDLVADFATAVDFNAKYPNRFRVVRYEDLSVKPYEGVQDIFQFLGLDFHPKVRRFLDSHTKVSKGGVYNTHRNSKSAAFHWRQDLSYKEVEDIQSLCRPAMERWGYLLAANSTHQRDLNPLSAFALKT